MSPDHGAQDLVKELGSDADLGSRLIGAYRSEIPEYLRLSSDVLERDIVPTALSLVAHLLADADADASTDLDEAFESELRDSAVRRFHQGISLDALMHSYRLWGRLVWKVIVDQIDRSDPAQVDFGFEIANRLMAYLDHASVVVAQAFAAEVVGSTHDRSIVRGPLLDAILGEAFDPSREVERQLVGMSQRLQGPHMVLDITGGDYLGAGSAPLRTLISDLHAHLRPTSGTLIVGARSNELVVIYPIDEDDSQQSLESEIDKLANRLRNLIVGVGRRHDGIDGIAMGYKEAAESASFGDSLRWYGRAIYFRDVLLDHIARTSKHSTSLIADTLRPLEEYDRTRSTTLVQTLKTFYECRFSLTGAARHLHVHPNTVTYRLRRVQELTGLNPYEPDDLLLLSLGLKFWTLNQQH